ncbi:DUF3726 domain-containing protein [Roseovarius azorensis]|nr:DUF3726 domain-containing protein [Roseovarius azorensis]
MIKPNDPTRAGSAPVPQTGNPAHLSLSEIQALCFKAARGAGHDWGHAEEAGWAAAWLAAAGLPGPALLLAWLRETDLAAPLPARDRWTTSGRRQCPLRTGVALADHAALPEGPGVTPLVLENLAHPAIILPFVARAAHRIGSRLLVRCGAGMIDPCSGRLSRTPSDSACLGTAPIDLIILREDGITTNPPTPAPHYGVISLLHWQALDALALRITVPPSAQSRTGAGAEGGDND